MQAPDATPLVQQLPVLELQFAASMRLFYVASTVHVVALVLLMAAQPAGWVMALSALGVGISWRLLRRNETLGFGANAVQGLHFHADGRISLRLASGQVADAELLSDSRVGRWLLVLNFLAQPAGAAATKTRRYSRALGGDELSADALRRLRLRLQLQAGVTA